MQSYTHSIRHSKPVYLKTIYDAYCAGEGNVYTMVKPESLVVRSVADLYPNLHDSLPRKRTLCVPLQDDKEWPTLADAQYVLMNRKSQQSRQAHMNWEWIQELLQRVTNVFFVGEWGDAVPRWWWPSSVHSIKFQSFISANVLGNSSLPKSLRSLVVQGSLFSLDILRTSAPSLTELDIHQTFGRLWITTCLDNLPLNLSTLRIHGDYDGELGRLPPSLTSLSIHGHLRRPLHPLPPLLTHLHVQFLNVGPFDFSNLMHLTEMKLGLYARVSQVFKQQLVIPSSMRKLTIVCSVLPPIVFCPPVHVHTMELPEFEARDLSTLPSSLTTLNMKACDSVVDFQRFLLLKHLSLGSWMGLTTPLAEQLPIGLEYLEVRSFYGCTSHTFPLIPSLRTAVFDNCTYSSLLNENSGGL